VCIRPDTHTPDGVTPLTRRVVVLFSPNEAENYKAILSQQQHWGLYARLLTADHISLLDSFFPSHLFPAATPIQKRHETSRRDETSGLFSRFLLLGVSPDLHILFQMFFFFKQTDVDSNLSAPDCHTWLQRDESFSRRDAAGAAETLPLSAHRGRQNQQNEKVS